MATMSTPQTRPLARARKRVWIWIVFAVLALVGGVYAFIEQPWQGRPAKLVVEVVARRPLSQVLAVNGRVAASHTVNIRSLVAAQVMEVAVAEGDAVDAGDVLVQLNTSQPEALVQQAQASLDASKVQQQQARANADRATALGDNTTRVAREDAERSLTAASNEVKRLEAGLDQARSQLALYTITAPLTGVVLNRAVDRGQLVDAQTELFTIADLDDLVVETDVDEIYSSRIHRGLRAFLRPAGDRVARDGTVSFAAPTVDTSTGGRAIKIAFDKPVDLPVGLTVNVNIIVSQNDAALSVPRSAIVTEGARSHVLVIAQGTVTEREINFEDWPAERVIITDGLVIGDSVILDPASVTAGQAAEAA